MKHLPSPGWTRELLAFGLAALIIQAPAGIAAGALGADATMQESWDGAVKAAGPIGACSLRTNVVVGCEEWTFQSDAGETDHAYAIVASPSSDLVYAGGLASTDDGYDFVVRGLDASTGFLAWSRTWGLPGHGYERVAELAVDPGGRHVAAVGTSGVSTAMRTGHYGTAVFDAATGTPVWTSFYPGPTGAGNEALDLAYSPDGETLYVTGISPGLGTEKDVATLAFDSETGRLLWTSRYNGPEGLADGGFRVSAGPEGQRVYVTGGTRSASSGLDALTLALDADTGDVLWTETYAGAAGLDDLTFLQGLSADGTVLFAVGYVSITATLVEFLVQALDAETGTPVWEIQYNVGDPWLDVPIDLALSPDGSALFVTGNGHNGPIQSLVFQDFETAAFDAATGSVLWEAVYDGPTHGIDAASGIAVSPDGSHVFVTGGSLAASTLAVDMVTLSYDATGGALAWEALYNGPETVLGIDTGLAATTSPDGSRLYVAGSSASFTQGWFFVAAYDAQRPRPPAPVDGELDCHVKLAGPTHGGCAVDVEESVGLECGLHTQGLERVDCTLQTLGSDLLACRASLRRGLECRESPL